MRERLRALTALLTLGLQADRRSMVILFGATLVGQIAVLGTTYVAKLLTDAVVRRSLSEVLGAAGLGFVAALVAALCGRAYITLTITVEEKVLAALDERLIRLVAGVPSLEHLERPQYLDTLDLLRSQRSLIAQMVNAAVRNFRVWVQLAGTMLLLGRIHPALLALPLFGLGSVLTGRQAHMLQARSWELTTEPGRLKRQLFTLATSAEAGKEVRVFGLANELIARHHTLARRIERINHHVAWQAAGLDVLGALGFTLGYAAAVALVLMRALSGAATPGDVVLILALAAQMNATVAAIVDMGDYLRRAMVAAMRCVWLVDYAAQQTPTDPPAGPLSTVPEALSNGIDLVDVTFRYPGTDADTAPILSGVNLHLPAGKLVALVGENGAGKSTLVKLLSRFYSPSSGEILVDGIPLERFLIDGWRARLSAGFQDFARFELLARETVGVGHLSQIDDRVAIAAALERGGAADVVAALPTGLETQLGKAWPGGVELSGGQWQKLALARAAMRTAPLAILFDEPTAALDAPTEHALFERMAAAARSGRTRGAVTLVVSHRFSTVRMADLIVVLANGRILETGSHDALMQRGGLYAELYTLQAQGYR